MGGVLPVGSAAGPCFMTDGAWLPTGPVLRETAMELLESTLETVHIHKTPPCILKDSETASFAAWSIRTALELGCGERVVFE